ncbi:MAG TPA: SpoIIE family protein phosphatase [Chloroflexi bacterium]|jgi:serine phosphatase RsbU (regulator of sigma subunit)|nr:SpoIIE family protein phosphatase [Chloroflexota bacterium]
MEVQVGAAKVAKYATSESGDTLEIIERPHGGISMVMVDGQRSGRSAKIISNIAARKAISLLGEGVRDGAAIRATHDYLRTHRGGQVSAELQVVSVDLVSRTLVISRNSRCPTLTVQEGELRVLDESSEPIGIYPNTKPVITELPLTAGTYVVAYTDGLNLAEQAADGGAFIYRSVLDAAAAGAPAQVLADTLLNDALQAEKGRPRDDISVLVVAVLPNGSESGIRRFSARLPVR